MGTILITGANGFVGSRLCQVLAVRGRELKAVFRQKYSFYAPWIKNDITVGEIGSRTQWKETLTHVESVIHLAACVHVFDVNTISSNEFYEVNYEGTMNLAWQAAKAGVKRFIFLSTVKVNGESTRNGSLFTVDDLPSPVGAYAISKYKAEQGLIHISKMTNMEVVIIRSPLVYGPGVKGNYLKMLDWLYSGMLLPFGAIENRRSMIALENLIDIIEICLSHPKAANQIFLVSDGIDLTTTSLLKDLGRALGRPVRLLPVPVCLLTGVAIAFGRKDLACRLCGSLQVDLKKVKALLGWEPVVTVDEALRATARSYLVKKALS